MNDIQAMSFRVILSQLFCHFSTAGEVEYFICLQLYGKISIL